MFAKPLLSLAALPLLVALASNVALAAPAPTRTIAFNFNLNYVSVMGGSFSAPATLSGDVDTDGQIGKLQGTVYAPLGEQDLRVEPTAPTAVSDNSFGVYWWRWTCDPFGCRYDSGMSTFTQQVSQSNVDIRLGHLRGNGTLSWSTNPVCAAACPPPGASYWVSGSASSSLNGAVLSNQDAGRINAYGGAPTIQ
jgi:hypothetical protein